MTDGPNPGETQEISWSSPVELISSFSSFQDVLAYRGVHSSTFTKSEMTL